MKRQINLKYVILFIILIATILVPVKSVKAAGELLPTAYDNLRIGLRSTSELVVINSGYMRVFYNGSKICIEYYDNSFNIKSKKTVAMELDIWGGFYAGKNAYYVVEGKNNKAEDNNAEVIRVIKYDTNWKRLGAAKIISNTKLFGGEVRYPFDYGCVEMKEHNGNLYIVTGHEGYVDSSVGQGHQGFLMIKVNQSSMTGEIVKSDLWHSFAQYIDYKDSNLYVLEQSEGSRYTKLSKYNEKDLKSNSIPVLKYGGDRTSAWAIPCFASVDDMVLSSSNALCLGTSIDQSKYDSVSSKMAHNIYLTVTPMNNFSEEATKIKWITNYANNGKSFIGTKITKINDNRFMISWEEYGESKTANIDDTLSKNILHYVFVDGNGNKLSKEFKIAAPISDCHPIVKNSKIVFYASNDNMVNFYSIDANNGSFTKKAYRVAGENIIWNLNNGVLTLNGKGEISVDTEAKHRGPVSSTAGGYTYSSSDNSWKPIKDKVKKIVIGKGITKIRDNAFKYFDNLKEVEIQDGLKSIGKQAFYGCDYLSKITIPSSVTSIGEDFLWTGSYWIYDNSHVVRATIYAPSNSYAIKYAKKKGITYKVIATNNKVVLPKKVSNFKTKTQTTNSITLNWSKVSGANGYQIQTYNASKKKWVNVANTTKTSYKVTKLGKGKTYKYRVRAYKTINKVKKYGSWSSVLNSGTKTSAPKISRITTGRKKANLRWNKVSGANGYEIYMATTKKGKYKKVKTVTKGNAIKYTKSKLKKNKRYYFKVRTYKKVNGKKIYSSYSSIKSIKVK